LLFVEPVELCTARQHLRDGADKNDLSARLYHPHVYWRRPLPSISQPRSPKGRHHKRTGRCERHCAHRAIVPPRRSR